MNIVASTRGKLLVQFCRVETKKHEKSIKACMTGGHKLKETL